MRYYPAKIRIKDIQSQTQEMAYYNGRYQSTHVARDSTQKLARKTSNPSDWAAFKLFTGK